MSGIDVVVANRVQALRRSRHLTPDQMADLLGIEAQRLLRYEAGEERVTAAHLVDLARLFEVPVSSFFEGLERSDSAERRLEGSPGDHAMIKRYLFENLSDTQRDTIESLLRALTESPESKGRSHGT